MSLFSKLRTWRLDRACRKLSMVRHQIAHLELTYGMFPTTEATRQLDKLRDQELRLAYRVRRTNHAS